MSAFRVLPPLTGRQRPWRLVERNVLAYRRTWVIFLTGFFALLSLSGSGILGLYSYRNLVKSLSNRAAELPLAGALGHRQAGTYLPVAFQGVVERRGRRSIEIQRAVWAGETYFWRQRRVQGLGCDSTVLDFPVCGLCGNYFHLYPSRSIGHASLRQYLRW